MLVVLAIIAVLSVGGIAGYSKAMEMYKINKYKSGMYELIGGFLPEKVFHITIHTATIIVKRILNA